MPNDDIFKDSETRTEIYSIKDLTLVAPLPPAEIAVAKHLAFIATGKGKIGTVPEGTSVTSAVPATASSTGSIGQMAADSEYVYVCTAPNTWKRASLATW